MMVITPTLGPGYIVSLKILHKEYRFSKIMFSSHHLSGLSHPHLKWHATSCQAMPSR